MAVQCGTGTTSHDVKLKYGYFTTWLWACLSRSPFRSGFILPSPSWVCSQLHISYFITKFSSIVFVHGINGDPSRTWVHVDRDGSFNWVAGNGFLPSMLPFCRIFTFRWNASILHYNSDADIKHIASNLLSLLGARRTSHEVCNPAPWQDSKMTALRRVTENCCLYVIALGGWSFNKYVFP